MKLKYYLRGLGMGILFATIVMMVHNNNLPPEEIIKQAKELGMIMPEDTEEKNGLWGDKDKEEIQEPSTEDSTPSGTEGTQETESQTSSDTQNVSDNQTIHTEEASNSQATVNSEEPLDSQAVINSEEVSNSQMSVNTEGASEGQISVNTEETSSDTQEISYVTIKINARNSAERVCRILYQNGLIDSEESFHAYLQENGYTHIIQKGTFRIPKGATYEEICRIIIKDRYL